MLGMRSGLSRRRLAQGRRGTGRCLHDLSGLPADPGPAAGGHGHPVGGGFLAQHHDEILNLARRAAEREGETHPLHRIMDIERQDDGIVITTTDIHLPRLIGQSMQKAYSGELKITYGEDSYSVRVDWSRDS